MAKKKAAAKKKNTSVKKVSGPRGGVTMAARTKSRRRSKRKFTLPMAPIIGFIPYVQEVRRVWKYGGMRDVAKIAPKVVGWDGFTNSWHIKYIGHVGGWAIVAGFLAHIMANRLGVNRMIANAGIPIIRI